MPKRRSPATLAIHPREDRTPGPLVTPIVMSSTFRLRDARQGGEFTRAIAPKEYYTRWGNPTVADLEDTVAKLEGGTRALATGSGMGAIAPTILTFVTGGGRVVAGGRADAGPPRSVWGPPPEVRGGGAGGGPR